MIAYLTDALYEAKDQYKDNQDFISKIDICLRYLRTPSLENIDKCIKDADEAFQEIGQHICV